MNQKKKDVLTLTTSQSLTVEGLADPLPIKSVNQRLKPTAVRPYPSFFSESRVEEQGVVANEMNTAGNGNRYEIN